MDHGPYKQIGALRTPVMVVKLLVLDRQLDTGKTTTHIFNYFLMVKCLGRSDKLVGDPQGVCLYRSVEYVYVCVFIFRSRRTLESRQNMDDDKIATLEEELRKAKAVAVEAERSYEEV